MVKSFTELTVWQKSHKLAIEIYKITKKLSTDAVYGLIHQISGFAVSVTQNIAESADNSCRLLYGLLGFHKI